MYYENGNKWMCVFDHFDGIYLKNLFIAHRRAKSGCDLFFLEHLNLALTPITKFINAEQIDTE